MFHAPRLQSLSLLAVVLAFAVATVAACGAAGTPVALPDTPLGRHARAYLAAYASGDSATIARYAEEDITPAVRGRVAPAGRRDMFRSMREERGALTVDSVPVAEDRRLVVVVRDAHGELHGLTFEGDETSDHRLVGVQWEPLERASDAVPGPPLDETQLAAAVHAAVDARVKASDFSGVVLLARGDRVLAHEARGLADRTTNRAISPGTKFNVGSINKAFTKVAIAQLAQAGKLSLSDKVTRWLPEYRVANAEKITLEQLVEHRAGVGNIFGPAAVRGSTRPMRTLADWMTRVVDQPLEFEPGTEQRYSNGGYVLLGAVIERVSGEGYYDYVKNHISAPCGMKDTDWYAHDVDVADRAEGYTRAEERGGPSDPQSPRRPAAPMMPLRGSPAGGGYSNAWDLWRFAEALRAQRLVSAAWTGWVFGGPVPAPGDAASADRAFADVGWGIAGGAPGTNAVLELAGPYDLVILTNDDPPGAEDFARDLRRLLRRAPRPS